MGRFVSMLLVAAGACGGTISSSPSTMSDSGSQCRWPTSLTVDAGSPVTAVGRFLVACTYDAGGLMGAAICVSDDLAACPGGPQLGSDCVDRCSAEEYAVATDGLEATQDGGTTLPSGLPSSCRRDISYPYWCCPCQ